MKNKSVILSLAESLTATQSVIQSDALVPIYRERMKNTTTLRYVPHLFSKKSLVVKKIGTALLTACVKMQKLQKISRQIINNNIICTKI